MKKLAIITTHPIQYNAPFFKLLHQHGVIEIKVFYTWSQTKINRKFDPGFNKVIQWDIPLLEGYNYTFVNNIAKQPGTHHFKGIINPTLNNEIEDWDPHAILIYGWSYHSHLKCIRHFYRKKIPVLFRGDSTMLDKTTGLKKLLRTTFLKWVYHHITYALYVGTNNKLYYLHHGVRQKQLVFVPHAVDNERFFDCTDTYSAEALLNRQKLGVNNNDTVFLYAGKLETKKNPFILISAFKNIMQPNLHLIIVGNGPLEQELTEMCKGISNIHFLNFKNQSEMPVVYRMCNVFVLPSKGPGETWGLCVNEAMACSRAVIVSDKCGCYIDLIKDGINGYTFNSHKLEDLTDKMSIITSNQKRLLEMGKRSLEIIKNWSIVKSCEQVEKLLIEF